MLSVAQQLVEELITRPALARQKDNPVINGEVEILEQEL